MAKRKRRRRLSSIKVSEVSFVDKPANQTPFLFFKQDEGIPMDIDKQAKNIAVSFSTDRTPDNTVIQVNGNTLKGVRNFSLYYWPLSLGEIGIGLEYTLGAKGETKDGFEATRTYRLRKGIIPTDKVSKADPNDIAVIKELCGDVDEHIDHNLAKALSEQIQTIGPYRDALPAELRQAIINVVKLATETELVEEEDVMNKEDQGTGAQEEGKQEPANTGAEPVGDTPSKTPVVGDPKVETVPAGEALKPAVLSSEAVTQVVDAVMAAIDEKAKQEIEAQMEEVDEAALLQEATEEALADAGAADTT